jgi:PAS domain S-box-containing protein
MRRLFRFPPPLHILVPLVALVCGFLYVLFKLTLVTEWGVERITETQLGRAQNSAQTLVEVMTRGGAARQQGMANHISKMERYAALNWAAVCDAEGKILFSTKHDWVGKRLSEVARPAAVELANEAARNRAPTHVVEGQDFLIAAHPGPATAGAPVPFVSLVERDLAEVISGRYSYGRREAWISAGIVIVSNVILGVILYAFLKWRMRSFYRKTGLDDGRLSDPEPLSGADEFAEISHVLTRAEHLLRDIAENLEEVVWITTPELTPIYVSPAFEKIYLRGRDEVSTEPGVMPDYVLKEYHAAFAEARQALIKGAPDMHVEYRVVRGDNEVRWMEARGFPVRDASGRLLRIVGISRDITARKNLQEEMVNVSEQERHNLAYDLHDDACQRLAAIKLKSETLSISLKNEQSAHARLATELTTQIAGTSTLLRNIARGLAPVDVDGGGLMHALLKLVQMQESIHEVPCFFETEPNVVVTNETVATYLYRIAQEFINNAARHAKPTRIDVRLEQMPDWVRLMVTNDGLPFKKNSDGLHGMGLKIIRHRAAAIGATVEFHPRADGVTGTVAECVVPLDICHMHSANYKIAAKIREVGKEGKAVLRKQGAEF